MAKTVITLEEIADGKAVVYIEADENQKGFLKDFADYVVRKAQLGDNVSVVRRGAVPVAAPVIEYRDRVVEKVVEVEKVVYRDRQDETNDPSKDGYEGSKIVSHVKRVLHPHKK